MSVVGTVDMNHKFYLIGVGISRFEDEPSITAMLQTIKGALLSFFDFVWKQEYGMADHAGVIANAFQKVFPGTGVFPKITLAKYYFHVNKGLEDNSHRFKSSQHFAQFVADSKQQVFSASGMERKYVGGQR